MNHFFTSSRLFSILCLFLFFNPLFAQQNGSFENWSPSGSQPPFDWKFPTGWTTTNATTEFITAGVTRNNYNHSGEFAAQIKTLNIFGTLRRSQLALGNCKLDFPNYQVKPYTGGEPLTLLPTQVSFYYQLTVGHPSEHAVADILIKRPSGSSDPDTVYYTSVLLPAVNIYTEIKVLMPDVGINTTTDSIVILFSSNDTNEIGLNTLYVDDVSIDFVSAADPGPTSASSINLYPNPVRSEEALNVNFPDNKFHSIRIVDNAGKIIASDHGENIIGNKMHIRALHLPPGIYCLIADDRYSHPFVVLD